MALPLVFKMVKSKAAGSTGGSSASNEPLKKKIRIEEDKNDKDRRVLNHHQFDAFKLKVNEAWNTCCDVCQLDKPAWEGNILMCSRWYIRGCSFNDWVNTPNHVAKEQVSAEKG